MAVQPIKNNVEVDQKSKFHKALYALHNDIEVMKKDESNPFFKSKYVPLPKMLEVLKPKIKEHGFILSQPVDVTNSANQIENVVFSSLIHVETGYSDTAKLALPKLDDMQKLGGAITYARRYTLSALLSLEEIDDDGNTAVGNKVSSKTRSVKTKDKF